MDASHEKNLKVENTPTVAHTEAAPAADPTTVEKHFDASTTDVVEKQKSWGGRWASRFKKAFDYVHEKSVAFNERGFDGNDIVAAAKKLENGGFGDGTKIYAFFAEGGYKAVNGIRDAVLEKIAKLRGSRVELADSVHAMNGSASEEAMHATSSNINKLAEGLLVTGDGFIVTSMARRAQAKAEYQDRMLNLKFAEASASGHSHPQETTKKNDLMKLFANLNAGGGSSRGHGDHGHGGGHH